MIVTCPNCGTKFNLPEEMARPGAKLRCSVCKHVFKMPDEALPHEASLQMDAPRRKAYDADSETSGPAPAAAKTKRSYKGLLITIFLLALAGGAAYGTWTYTSLLDNVKELMAPSPEQNQTDLVRLIALRGVRQYNINNEKIGNISVIEGKTVNGFPEPRELIRVEASLYDAAGNVLVSKQQLAGTSVSLFQLQVLGEQELEQALANKIDILTNNTNVPPGGEVPFMVVFYNPPDNATEFGVKVIDARLPPNKK